MAMLRTSLAVPSGELSSTKTSSHATSGSALSTALTSRGTLRASLKVGTMIASSAGRRCERGWSKSWSGEGRSMIRSASAIDRVNRKLAGVRLQHAPKAHSGSCDRRGGWGCPHEIILDAFSPQVFGDLRVAHPRRGGAVIFAVGVIADHHRCAVIPIGGKPLSLEMCPFDLVDDRRQRGPVLLAGRELV